MSDVVFWIAFVSFLVFFVSLFIYVVCGAYRLIVPGPAPRAPSNPVPNAAMSVALQTDAQVSLQGIHDVSCAPHGANPGFGWTCQAHVLNQGSPLRVTLVSRDFYGEDALYKAGMTFSITQDAAPLAWFPGNDGSGESNAHPLVALSLDPNVASFEDTRQALAEMSDRIGQAVQRTLIEQANAAEQAKTPAQRAQENRASWQIAVPGASAS